MRHHPANPSARRHAFGFDAIMAEADRGRFRRWHDASSLLAPGRTAVAGVFSAPEAGDRGDTA